MGEQSLADPLRYLIENQVDVTAILPELMTGGATMRHCLLHYWNYLDTKPEKIL